MADFNRIAITGTAVQVRLDDKLLARLEDWRRKQSTIPSRPEAVRQLLGLILCNSEISKEPAGVRPQ